MKVLLFGASGMVGQAALRECLADPSVELVRSVGRHALGTSHPKLKECVVPDLAQLDPFEGELSGFDAAFFCVGVTSAGRTEAEYTRLTYDLTLAVARPIARWNPGLAFVYVSGAGTDSTERGRTMWARVKGRTENELLRLPFRAAYMFRPGVILARHGIRSRTPAYRVTYLILSPFLELAGLIAPSSVTTTEKLGRAMIHVVQRGAPQPWISTREINRLAA